ncbi:Transthyretin [Periconia macrospinosa]|uniref:Transthyretin n=1 Tax=Periconia macrospinosa TaxID=97972 RepID=A0A2V1E2Z4_9PLEO|nr:Transthyretin [Periconia macrospinosa]
MAAPQTPAEKPPITCHVLDTTIGRPASGISVTLRLDNPPPRSSSSSGGDVVFKGLTNTDGRVVAWDPVTSPRTDNSNNITLKEVFNTSIPDPFFEEVVVKFVVSQEQRERGEHFHVPLLLGGFGFTVYRGS